MFTNTDLKSDWLPCAQPWPMLDEIFVGLQFQSRISIAYNLYFYVELWTKQWFLQKRSVTSDRVFLQERNYSSYIVSIAEVLNFGYAVKVSTCVWLRNATQQSPFRFSTTVSLRRNRGSINYRNTQLPRASKTSISFQQWRFLPWQCWNITPIKTFIPLFTFAPSWSWPFSPFTCFLCFLFKSRHPFSPNW